MEIGWNWIARNRPPNKTLLPIHLVHICNNLVVYLAADRATQKQSSLLLSMQAEFLPPSSMRGPLSCCCCCYLLTALTGCKNICRHATPPFILFLSGYRKKEPQRKQDLLLFPWGNCFFHRRNWRILGTVEISEMFLTSPISLTSSAETARVREEELNLFFVPVTFSSGRGWKRRDLSDEK